MDLSHKKLRLEIQTMHKDVIRARVQTCRKLIAEIKKISQKKTVDKLKHEKNIRKVQRLTNEVHFLRHMKPNLIAKFCLSHTEESLENLRKQPDVTPQLRALAKVSSHKLIKPLVDEFRKKFPKWRDTLPKLLEKDSEVLGIISNNDENPMENNENLNESAKDHAEDGEEVMKKTPEKKLNSKKISAQFSHKLSAYKLKTTLKKRKLSNSDFSDLDKRKSLPGNNVKNWLVENNSENEKDSFFNNRSAENAAKSKDANSPKKNKKRNSISLKENDENYKSNEMKNVKVQKIDKAENADSEDNEDFSLENQKESFFNRSAEKIDKSLKINEEKTNIKSENVISAKKSKRKSTISHEENHENYKNNEVKNAEVQKIDGNEEIKLKNEYNEKLGKSGKLVKKIVETVQQQEDPFFITKDNNKYLTFGKIEEPKVEISPKLSVINRSNFPKQSTKIWNDRKYFTNTERFVENSNFDKYSKRTSNNRKSFSADVCSKEQLHPSWEAKKRTSSLVPFQGKKISFDD
ncbi:hypothetical protein O3M35_008056 [Rhynocoris fuscipes]|uniref:Serum response factor-binding protein 1 n=1 Tax=Rhynocoris fuscipes TaxID=488301 RepID=A0AAW1D5Q6_9HEMI